MPTIIIYLLPIEPAKLMRGQKRRQRGDVDAEASRGAEHV
jgi:hypothetical protein